MSSAAVRALSLEYKSLLSDPVEGFRVKLIKDDNLFEWEVAIFGPPQTLYEGGYFKVSLSFLRSHFTKKMENFRKANSKSKPSSLNPHFREFFVPMDSRISSSFLIFDDNKYFFSLFCVRSCWFFFLFHSCCCF